MKQSPYVEHPLRLQDVLAAIQVMGTHRSDSSTIGDWTDRIGGPVSVSHGTWADVFKDHPEFFHLEPWVDPRDNQTKMIASLTWRRANEKQYDSEQQQELKPYEAHTRDRSTLHRKPLSAAQVGTLLKAAVDIDSRATASQARKDRLATTAVHVSMTLVGVILGWLLKTGG